MNVYHSHIHTYTHTLTHARMHTRTHAHTHIHTQSALLYDENTKKVHLQGLRYLQELMYHCIVKYIMWWFIPVLKRGSAAKPGLFWLQWRAFNCWILWYLWRAYYPLYSYFPASPGMHVILNWLARPARAGWKQGGRANSSLPLLNLS